jgi:RNA polymerase sigma-70 factor (ECF subfamily)
VFGFADSEHPLSEPDTSLDRGLVARVRSGDEQSFDEVYLQYAQSLWRFAVRILGSREEAEEVVHDVFATIWEQRDRWQVQSTIAAYLYRAVRNRAIDVVRHNGVIHRLESTEDTDSLVPGLGQPPVAPDEHVYQQALQRALHEAIAMLPERRRTALTLRYVQEMSYAEIASVLQVSENAAFMLVARTREMLRPLFERFTSG